jgi:cbb3-type cytochrome oxidase subunit 3
MIRELKYLFFTFVIFLFFFLTLKYYYSNTNKKNSYRSIKLIDEKIIKYSKKLILLKNNTNNVAIYIEDTVGKNKKKYNFWELINNND